MRSSRCREVLSTCPKHCAAVPSIDLVVGGCTGVFLLSMMPMLLGACLAGDVANQDVMKRCAEGVHCWDT